MGTQTLELREAPLHTTVIINEMWVGDIFHAGLGIKPTKEVFFRPHLNKGEEFFPAFDADTLEAITTKMREIESG